MAHATVLRIPSQVLLLTMLSCAVGCALPMPPPIPTAPTASNAPAAPDSAITAPSSLPLSDGTWTVLAPGLERSHILREADSGRAVERVYVLRVDPAQIRLDVAYAPGEARSLDRWLADTGALAVVNGGYFTAEFHATGLLIADSVQYGATYGAFAGMLAIDAAGHADLRWLQQQPFNPDEPLTAALQSFPLLVQPGGLHGFPDDGGLPARRTVVARDTDGRFLFIVAPGGTFTLHGLATWLVESDLAIDIALNLDGGTSSGLLVATPPEGAPGFVAVPSVVALYPR